MSPTIFDVAHAAGVGIGTVSRVLNRHPLVSPATRQRVLEAIERLGYRPSPTAQAFGGRRTHTLELVVPVFSGGFLLDILRGIEDALAQTPYTLTVRTVEDADERDRVFDECCARGSADGALVVWLSPTDAFLRRLASGSFAAVLLNAVHPGVSSVGVDHDLAAEQALTYCHRIGHRRMALVDQRQDPLDPSSPGMCQRAYGRFMADTGLPAPEAYERLAEPGAAAGADAADALLALDEPPTAIVAASEAQALGVMMAARKQGWRIPGDLSVVGYNDSPLARQLGLTTVCVPLRDMGRQAADVLVAALAQPEAEPTAALLPTELVVRQTCGAPAR